MRLIRLCAAAVLLVACGSTNVSVSPDVAVTTPIGAPATAGASAVPGTAPASTGGQSVAVPITARLDLDPQLLAIGKATPIALHVSLDTAATRVKGRLLGAGVVSIAQPTEQEWTNVAVGQTHQLQTTAQITGLGPGQITGAAEVLNADGTPLYGHDTTVFVLATDLGVLTGTAGPQQLRREYLERARAAGTITQEEYERALEENQYGGAETGITITVPTPAP